MSQILLIRHAGTDLAGTFCGHSDPELNAEGRAQLIDLVSALSDDPIRTVYSSDLRRAKSTAAAIADAKGIPCDVRAALREIDFGQWEGLVWDEIEQLDAAYAHRWIADYPNLSAPGGESFAAFQKRILEEIDSILRTANHPIAIVTHAGVIRGILRHLCACSEDALREMTKEYCSIVRCQYNRPAVAGCWRHGEEQSARPERRRTRLRLLAGTSSGVSAHRR